MKALGLFSLAIIFVFAEQIKSQEIEATLAGSASTDGFSVKESSDTLFRVTGEGNVGIGIATPSANLQVEGTTKLGTNTDVVAITDIIELTGTTASSGGSTNISYPTGWTQDNTRILCFELLSGGGSWAGVGWYINTVSTSLRYNVSSSFIQLVYPNNASFHSRPYRAILMKIN